MNESLDNLEKNGKKYAYALYNSISSLIYFILLCFKSCLYLYMVFAQRTTGQLIEVIVQWFGGVCSGRQGISLLPPSAPVNIDFK